MASASPNREELIKRYDKCPVDCTLHYSANITSLGDYFNVLHFLLEKENQFWFRGHSKLTYRLLPSALRFDNRPDRDKALRLVEDMKRFLEMKLAKPPASDDILGWVQVAQHYGLPTRLLDWTQNAAVALFFACCSNGKEDGLVIAINPIQLNQSFDSKKPRVFTYLEDKKSIDSYLELKGNSSSRGKLNIAINPTWNTERIALQNGVFTLHGNKSFEINREQAGSLVGIPILKELKADLLNELERVGVGEMFIFPEPEHVCAHLRRASGL